MVPWQWLASPALHPLSRCCAAEIQQALRALLAGEAFLADRPWSEIWWGRMRLDLASGWQLEIAIERDQLGALLWAQAADGRDWVYGCQRDDWTLGPTAASSSPWRCWSRRNASSWSGCCARPSAGLRRCSRLIKPFSVA